MVSQEALEHDFTSYNLTVCAGVEAVVTRRSWHHGCQELPTGGASVASAGTNSCDSSVIDNNYTVEKGTDL